MRPGGIPGAAGAQPVPDSRPSVPGRLQGAPGASRAFQQVLQEAERASGLRFSAHAEQRLQQAGIELSPERLQRLGEAVDRVARKGARESLVLLGDLALVVSVRNRTIITAVPPERARENVFTNIDSAVIT